MERASTGADDYLVKPFSAKELIARVGVHVRLARMRRAAEAEDARQIAEDANSAKSEFLTAMSHELRTPLNAIAGYAQLLEMGVHGPLTNEQREALNRIQRSESHLLALINDVLNFAKLEAGRVVYDVADVPLAEVAAEVVSMIEPQAVAKGLTVEVRVPPGLVSRADREKVSQILLNLLSNAVKFTEVGGRITIDAPSATGDADDSERDGSAMVFIRVSDTGCGIAREKQESVFEPFVQLRRKLSNTAEGTGLGLAISRDLARGMGGDLRVRSAEGEGAAFTVTLPAAS